MVALQRQTYIHHVRYYAIYLISASIRSIYERLQRLHFMHINIRVFIKILGILSLIEGLFMMPCVVAAIQFEEWLSAYPLFMISMLSVITGHVILTQFHYDKVRLHFHEGYLIAAVSWIFCSLIGALPFYFCGMDFSFINCYFESVAGFTTTGCTVLPLDELPHSLLLWKSLSNWLGGMGILVLLVSVFPALGISGQSIASAEATGPTFEKIGSHISDTGKILYATYIIFSAAEFILLLMGPLKPFDALINTFSSISTAGLLITTENAAAFAVPYTRTVIMIFTILSAMNYTLYYFVIKGDLRTFFKDIEIRVFAVIIAAASMLVALSLRISGTYSSLWQALKDGLCQVVSFISTSGYYVCDYPQWPTFTVTLLFCLLFVGGCCMSTSGSLKVFRIIVLFKLIKRGIFKQVHPRAVKAVVLNGKAVSADKVSAITTHIMLFFAVLLFSCLILSLNNFDMETTISTALGLFTNTGVAMGESGCSGYFGMYSGFSQLYLTFLMIAGRLEIYSVLILFSKSFWKRDKARNL